MKLLLLLYVLRTNEFLLHHAATVAVPPFFLLSTNCSFDLLLLIEKYATVFGWFVRCRRRPCLYSCNSRKNTTICSPATCSCDQSNNASHYSYTFKFIFFLQLIRNDFHQSQKYFNGIFMLLKMVKYLQSIRQLQFIIFLAAICFNSPEIFFILILFFSSCYLTLLPICVRCAWCLVAKRTMLAHRRDMLALTHAHSRTLN